VVLALSISYLGIIAVQPAYADSPTSTAASVLGYESALTGYKSLDGSDRTGWKESNETVGRIGGWRNYAKEAYKANQAEANAAAAGNAPMEDVSEAMEPAMTKPLPDVNATRMDPATDAPAKPDRSSITDQPMMPAGKPLSPPTQMLSYQSVLSDYRHYDDNPPGDWRAANERVGQIGGWRTYAKEAYEASQREASTDTLSGDSQ